MSYTDIAKVVRRSVTDVRAICTYYQRNKPKCCLNCSEPNGLGCIREIVEL